LPLELPDAPLLGEEPVEVGAQVVSHICIQLELYRRTDSVDFDDH
jgi:hypothetical protein